MTLPWYRSKRAYRLSWAIVTGMWAFLCSACVPAPWLFVTLWMAFGFALGGWLWTEQDQWR